MLNIASLFLYKHVKLIDLECVIKDNLIKESSPSNILDELRGGERNFKIKIFIFE